MIVLINSTLYTAGQPFARFRSNLAAVRWLRSIGAQYRRRLGDRMLFRLPA